MNPEITQLLNKHHIYFIPCSDSKYQAFFCGTSWGNYLIYPHYDLEKMHHFIKSCGGIYKLFDIEIPFPQSNKKLFDLFGASTVGSKLEFHPDFLVESSPEEFYDPDIKINAERGLISYRHGDQVFHFWDATAVVDETLPGVHLRRFNG
jgi:hypothetical protein